MIKIDIVILKKIVVKRRFVGLKLSLFRFLLRILQIVDVFIIQFVKGVVIKRRFVQLNVVKFIIEGVNFLVEKKMKKILRRFVFKFIEIEELKKNLFENVDDFVFKIFVRLVLSVFEEK